VTGVRFEEMGWGGEGEGGRSLFIVPRGGDAFPGRHATATSLSPWGVIPRLTRCGIPVPPLPVLGRFVEGARGDAGGLAEETEYIRSGPGVLVRSISYAVRKEADLASTRCDASGCGNRCYSWWTCVRSRFGWWGWR
jgi:hypothetical protein